MRLIVYVLFFLSGISGLIYQVVWSRMLSEVFGVTAYAITVVLATYLAGLALGAVVLGPVADRRASPLRFYAVLEIGIALTALFGVWLVRLLDPLHIAAANRFSIDSASLILARSLMASLIILPPTFLMGGTLPVITRAVVNNVQRLGSQLSLLYGLNTLGAVIGTLASGFVLIRFFGLHLTLATAVAINLAVGVTSFVVAARFGRESEGDDPNAQDDPEMVTHAAAETAVRHDHRGLLLVMATTGFASLGLEVFWTRLLVLVIGTTTYAFVTMLSSFLVGIALGSLLATRLTTRVKNLRVVFGWIQLGIAAATLASLPLFVVMGGGNTARWVEEAGSSWQSLLVIRFGVTFAIMLVPTTLIGMTFPLAAKMWVRDSESLGGDIGTVYGANTTGNILGAVVSGFFLLPAVGLQKGIAVFVILNLINAVWGLLPRSGQSRAIVARLRWVSVLAILGVSTTLLLAWQPQPFRFPGEGDHKVLYYREGVVATVKVVEESDGLRSRRMTVDSVTIGQNYHGVDKKQQALAHLPFVISKKPPRRVLTIGLGTGILVGEVLRHPEVERVECLELSPSVIEAADQFVDSNGDMKNHPAARIINDDGVNFLRRSKERYDAIISDAKSRNGTAGNALFYSADYYRLCREHLEPGGMMIQWVSLGMPPGELEVVLRTFASEFRWAYVWLGPPDACFVVGLDRRLELDVDRMRAVLESKATAHLRRYGWINSEGIVAALTADPDMLSTVISDDGTINTLEHPVLEFYSFQEHAQPTEKNRAENLRQLIDLRQSLPRDVELRGSDDRFAERVARHRGGINRLLSAYVEMSEGQTAAAAGLAQLQQVAREAPDNGAIAYVLATAYYNAGAAANRDGNFDLASRNFLAAVRTFPDLAEPHYDLSMLLLRQGREDDALPHIVRAAELLPNVPATVNNAAWYLGTHRDPQRRHPKEAIRLAERAVKLTDRQDATCLDTLSVVYALGGRLADAKSTAKEAVTVAKATGNAELAERIQKRLDRDETAIGGTP